MKYFPSFDDVEKQEIRSIIQVIKKSVGGIKWYRLIGRFIIERTLQMSILVCEDEFSMIEINLEAEPLFSVENIADSVIVLRNTDGFIEDAIVPSRMVVPGNIFKSVVIS